MSKKTTKTNKTTKPVEAVEIKPITLEDQVASLIAVTMLGQMEKLSIEFKKYSPDQIKVSIVATDKEVKFILRGSAGRELNNPDITIIFNEVFTIKDVPTEESLSRTTFEYYTTLYLLECANKDKEEV